MSKSVEVKVSVEEAQRMLDEFADPTKVARMISRAVFHAAKVLQTNTINKLKAKMGDKATNPSKRWGLTLVDGVRATKGKYGNAKTHIMGDFRLKWLELGTQPRKTTKGYNRGAVTGIHFFEEARQETDVEGAIMRSLTKSINNAKKKA